MESSFILSVSEIHRGETGSTYLRVCIEDFDPLGGDEQIDLSESLSVSICTLKGTDNNTETGQILPSLTFNVLRSLHQT